MKRLLITMIIALPAAAKKPPKPQPPTDPPPVVICDFDGDGVLTTWDGRSPHRCQWTVTDRKATYTFQIRSTSPRAESILLPCLAVTDVYPYGGDICAAPHESGWHELPYPETGRETPWSITLPNNGDCADDNNTEDTDGPDTFALTVSALKIRQGTVQLVRTNPTS